METTVNERIRLLFENSKEKRIRSYALKIGVAPTTLNECIKGSEPKYTLLAMIVNGEPSISTKWLLTGKGCMFKEVEDSSVKIKPPEINNREVAELRERIKYLEGQNDLLREQAGMSKPVEKMKGKSA